MTFTRRLAATAVRRWTRAYTWRLPPPLRNARRAEIESDLWEFEHDPERTAESAATLHILARLALGIPADLSWRAANRPAGCTTARVVALTTAVGLIVAGFWFYELRRPEPLPLPPAPMAFVAAPPPPPESAAVLPPR
jgi:hypothetical protein